MVLKLDVNSVRAATERSDLCYLIFLRHLIRSRTCMQSQIIFFSPIRPTFLHAFTSCSELPSNRSNMDPTNLHIKLARNYQIKVCRLYNSTMYSRVQRLNYGSGKYYTSRSSISREDS